VTPLPTLVGAGLNTLTGWRLDTARHAATWDSGEGAKLYGGRWNSPGNPVVYAALDPATAILEVAVHKGFPVLDTVPHVMTSFVVSDAANCHVINVEDIPNPNWLAPSYPSLGQQKFGDGLLATHAFITLPSVVSPGSWNLLFNPQIGAGKFSILKQVPFALDPRLHPSLRPK
jgi:RES domain-containing protein